MININIKDNLELYQDYNKCLELLKNLENVNFNYPDNITNFHIYSEIKNEKELLCVESFLATQNLEKCKLIIWSDYDISDNKLIKDYLDLIELRIYDPKKEALGTKLEGIDNYLNAHDTKYYLKSDLFRILITHKYGGIFVDMDIVFLRDFLPILDQEFFYQWGSDLDFENFGFCGTVMKVDKGSELSNLLINEILKTELLIPDSTMWGKDLFAKVYKKNQNFYIFPSTFFNTEWQMNTRYVNGNKKYNPEGLGTQCERGWFVKNEFSELIFEDAFSWHWHNSSYKNYEIKPDSKFDLLMKKTKKILKDKKII